MEGYKEIVPGVKLRNVAVGEKTHMVEFELAKGSIIPDHSHPNEQTGYLVSGKLAMRIGEHEEQLATGDSWCIKENISHGVRVLEGAKVIEVFSPPRQDYIDLLGE